ncbi:MAG: hypothetical protein MZV64_55340 [Ignavibacteriales bacterium]|nr:hypothetical protein [Ignavibacteriales bacterium]
MIFQLIGNLHYVLGDNCFSPHLDSMATTPHFGDSTLNPGDTLITSLHVTIATNDGTANVQVRFGLFMNPTDRIDIRFFATTIPTAVEDENTSC